MRPERAIQELVALKQEAETTQLMNGDPDLESWKAKVRSVFVASLGRDDHLIERFDNVHYWLSMWSTSTPQSAFDKARHNGIRNACGVIDAAIYQLKLLSEDNEPVDENAFDPELWEHVKNLVEDEDWGKLRRRPLSSSRTTFAYGPEIPKTRMMMASTGRYYMLPSCQTIVTGAWAVARVSAKVGVCSAWALRRR